MLAFRNKKVLLAIFIIAFITKNLSAQKKDSLNIQNYEDVADYVIVGAGNAGAALAARLSSEGFSVIVLEGGINQDNNPLIFDPLAASSLVLNYTNEFFWMLGHAEVVPPLLSPPPQNDRRWPAVTGALFGGTSSVNGMQYVRGNSEFFNRWQVAAGGDPAWGVANATAVYKRLETFNGVPGQYTPAIHGTKGPVDVRQASNDTAAATDFVNAVIALGLGYTDIKDFNDPNNAVGAFTYWQLTQKPDKTRESSSTAFLEPLRKISHTEYVSRNGNLRVISEARVQRILIDAESGEPVANGILAVVNGVEKRYMAEREVILSAGFQSTLLLQLSGIGDASRLRSLGIPVVYNNINVGIHAKNHPGFLLTGLGNVAGPISDPQALYTAGAFLSDPTRPDITRAYQLLGTATPGAPGSFTINSVILDPLSDGFVTLYNSDPNRMPFYNFRQYANPADINSAIALYGLAYNVLLNMGLVPQGPLPGNIPAVTTHVLTNPSTAIQNFHYQSANRMSTSPATGVVDPDGRVFGVCNLRVADVSIIPVNCLGGPQAPAYLVAEVISDKIINEAHTANNKK